ncbi:MAG: hypothetical protein WDZ41_05245 [Candidatus Babeliales bacterium]
MKKLILLFATMPLFAMKKMVNPDINQKTVDRRVLAAIPKKYEHLNVKIANKELKKGNVWSVFSKVIKNYEEKNAEKSMKWHARFQERIALDYNFLSSVQKENFNEIFFDLSKKVISIQPENIRNVPMCYSSLIFKTYAVIWLRKIIENDNCSGLEWRELLVPSDSQNTLTAEELKAKRLKILDSYGTLQTMKINKL